MKENSIELLRNELEEKRKALLDLLEYWYQLQAIVLPKLLYLYENYFGELELEIEHKSKIAYELERKAELVSGKLKSGERLTEDTLKFIDNVVSKEIEIKGRIQNEANSHFYYVPKQRQKNVKSFGNGSYKNTNRVRVPKSEPINHSPFHKEELDLSYIYRKLVKRLHPDRVGESDEFRRYWNGVQLAYKSQSYEILKLFYKALCYEEEMSLGGGSDNSNGDLVNKLKNHIKDLDISINEEKVRIEQMRNEEPFVFEDCLNDHRWIVKRQDQLRKKLFSLDNTIFRKQRVLRSILGYNSSACNFIPSYKPHHKMGAYQTA